MTIENPKVDEYTIRVVYARVVESAYRGVASFLSGDPDPEPAERGSYPSQPNDSLFEDQWGLAKIEAPLAWQKPRATGHGITIAVVDSGVDLAHPDLTCPGKLLVLSGAKIDSDGPPQDERGHGTHVAGIAGACTDNDIGVAGVAPDATIMPVNVLEADCCTEDHIPGLFDHMMASGIRFATANGAHVINLSIGPLPGESYFPEFHRETEDALKEAHEAGVVIAAAAGNFSLPLCEYPSLSRFVICVGATDRNDQKAWYSDFPNNVDRGSDEPGFEASVVAPGGQGTFCREGIVSTYLSTRTGNCDYPADYRDINGTSMAAPHVAGVAALVYDRLGGERSKENADRIVEAIIETADPLPLPSSILGVGRVNALEAVRAIEVPDDPAPDPSSEPSTDPSPEPSADPSPEPDPTESPSPDPTEAPPGEIVQRGPCAGLEHGSRQANPDDESGVGEIVVGTPGDDVLMGTAGDDIICGLGGDDTIRGGPGNDLLIGGPGNDLLIGGPGNDDLRGGPGHDDLRGNQGHDTIRGGRGRDVLRGGPGNDRLFGGAGHDVLFGGPGNDRLFGGPGRDRLFAGPRPGRNFLRGGRGFDRCRGRPNTIFHRSCNRQITR